MTEYPDERETICIGIWGKEENFFTLKGLVDTVAETLFIDFEYVEDKKTFLHPYRTAKILYNGEEIGYCVQVEPKGFGGNLTMIVGINADGTVAGAKVTSHAETPGLGAKSQADPNWITQFAGQTADGQLKVAKDGGTINAITGATITSRAVTDGVNTAAAYVATLG